MHIKTISEYKDINQFIGDIIIIMMKHYVQHKLLLFLWDNIKNQSQIFNNQNNKLQKNMIIYCFYTV